MPKRFTDGYFALGLMVGIGCTLLFLFSVNWWIQPSPQPDGNKPSGSENTGDYGEGWQEWWYWFYTTFIESKDSIAQWVMMVFTVIAAAILYLTLKRVDQTNRLALEANETLRESFEIEARAYVEVQKCRLIRSDKYQAILSFELTNKGSTPAKDLLFYCNYDWFDEPVDAAPRLSFSGKRTRAVLGRDGIVIIETPIHPHPGANSLDDVSKGLAIAILVAYRDVFGKKRRTLFCAFLTPQHVRSSYERFSISHKHNRST